MTTNNVQCLLGNGTCPKTCGLYEQALQITTELGTEFVPSQSRIAVMLGDAFEHRVSVFDVAAAVGSCALEDQQPKKG